MVFGQGSSPSSISNTINQEIELSDNENETQPETQLSRSNTDEKDASKPLLQEVTFIGVANSKNSGGCKVKYTNSYTRIYVHFFGAPIGKKAEIKRCPVLVNDREKYLSLLNKVKLAESGRVSKSLTHSTLTKSRTSSSKKPIEEAFGVMERSMVDLKIIRGLCANGIPFNVLRNPHFLEMVRAIKKAPDGYKPPSSEKARTNLLDECVRDVEKELTPFKDTWYSQGLSIVSDGWSNVKHNPLINVIAVNSRGAMFMYAE